MPPFLHWIGYPSNPRHHLRRVGGRGGGLFRMGMRACAVRTPPILLLLFLFAQDWMMLNGDGWTFNYDLAPEAGKPFPRIRCSQPWRLGGQRRCLSVYFFLVVTTWARLLPRPRARSLHMHISPNSSVRGRRVCTLSFAPHPDAPPAVLVDTFCFVFVCEGTRVCETESVIQS